MQEKNVKKLNSYCFVCLRRHTTQMVAIMSEKRQYKANVDSILCNYFWSVAVQYLIYLAGESGIL